MSLFPKSHDDISGLDPVLATSENEPDLPPEQLFVTPSVMDVTLFRAVELFEDQNVALLEAAIVAPDFKRLVATVHRFVGGRVTFQDVFCCHRFGPLTISRI